jgi:NADH dehydrogenase FAD-containing subunit
MMHKEVARKVQNRLQSMGVNIFLNRRLVKEDIDKVYINDMESRAKTVVWTAGTQTNQVYKNIQGLQFDTKGKVLVNEYLEAKGNHNFFVVGDAASTSHSGTAQTALYDGGFAARVIASRIQKRAALRYSPRPPMYAIPIGNRWAAIVLWGVRFYGFFPWCLRRLADLNFFLSILPLKKALCAFLPGRVVSVSCKMCKP